MPSPSPPPPGQPPSPPTEALQDVPPAPFEPLFTLVTNTTTSTTHHPRIHYLFADDDPETLTRALAASHAQNTHPSPSSPSASNPAAASAAPAPRALILDLVPTPTNGWAVAAASSLTSDFAVLGAEITRVEDSQREDGGLMLRIDGVENERASPGALAGVGEDLPSSGSAGQMGGSGGQREEYGPILDEFDKRMGVMRRVVAVGEERLRRTRGEEAKDKEEEG